MSCVAVPFSASLAGKVSLLAMGGLGIGAGVTLFLCLTPRADGGA
jgi:hypothetical protein